MGKPRTLSIFRQRKRRREKIVMLTAYDLISAQIAAEGGVDAILVGDSAGMVMMGHETTLPVTVADMVYHCQAVMRAAPGVPVIADMPYGSFHVSCEETVRNALRLVKEGGAAAVKIEGGRKRQAVIEALLAAEIPVMGHLGLTPQSIHKFGGYKVQGRGRGAAALMIDDAEFLQEIGCFSLVLECIPPDLARRISGTVNIPTIGIGAGASCDGQVLVWHDLLGLFSGEKPRFVKRYAELRTQAVAAVRQYGREVRDGTFPGPEHCYPETEKATPASETEDDEGQPGRAQGYLASCEPQSED